MSCQPLLSLACGREISITTLAPVIPLAVSFQAIVSYRSTGIIGIEQVYVCYIYAYGMYTVKIRSTVYLSPPSNKHRPRISAAFEWTPPYK